MFKWIRYGTLGFIIGFVSFMTFAQNLVTPVNSIIEVQEQENYAKKADVLGKKLIITDDLWNLNDNLAQFEKNLKVQDIRTNSELFQMATYLQKQSTALMQCVEFEGLELQYLKDNLSYLKDLKNDDRLKKQALNLAQNYQLHFEKKAFCSLLSFRLQQMQTQLINILYLNTIEYFKNRLPFIGVVMLRIHEQHDGQFVFNSWRLFSYFGFYVPKQLWAAGLFLMFFFSFHQIYNFICHIFRNYFKFKLNYQFDLKIDNFGQRFIYFILINPFIYHLIRNGFAHTINVLDQILSLFIFNALFLANFIYMMFMLKIDFPRKSIGKLTFILVNLCFIIYMLMNINYKVLFNQMDIALTTSYYILFFAFQSFVFCMYKWIFYPLSKNIHHFLIPPLRLCLAGVLIINFFLGLCGYLNFAITFDINILFTIVLLLWAYIFRHVWYYIFNSILDEEHFIGRKLSKWTNVKMGQEVMELSIIKYLVMLAVYLRITFAIAAIWFLSPSIYQHIHDLVWHTQSVLGVPFVLMNIILAILAFIAMIFMSRILSKMLAYRIFQVEDDVEKFERVLFISASTLSVFFSLSIAGVDLSNFTIVMGGLTVGIGIGLKNLLNNFISGLLLMVYHPISVGDYVSVGNMKGYVKKIRLMGSQIETNDRSTVMVPNNVILSSIIENYTYNKNYIHNVHFKFSFMSLYDYDLAKKIILQELIQHKEILTDELHKPIILFTPRNESNIAFDVEVICTPKNLHVRDQVISDLNLRILNALIAAKLHVALGQTPFDKPEESTS